MKILTELKRIREDLTEHLESLSNIITEIQTVATMNCFEIALLKAKLLDANSENSTKPIES